MMLWEEVFTALACVEGLVFSVFSSLGVCLLQVLEQLSGQTPVFSKGELGARVCRSVEPDDFSQILQLKRFKRQILMSSRK
jgi:hypothetical protein